MDALMLVPGGVAIAVLAYQVGKWTTDSPSEAMMLERLIILRTQRLLISISEKDISKEVTDESDRRAARAKQ